MGDVSKTPKLLQVKSIVAAATLQPTDSGIIFVGNTGTMTVTLPPAATSAGVEYKFVKTSAAASAITVDGNASETINGSTTHATMDAQYDTITIVCNGTAWYITESIIA